MVAKMCVTIPYLYVHEVIYFEIQKCDAHKPCFLMLGHTLYDGDQWLCTINYFQLDNVSDFTAREKCLVESCFCKGQIISLSSCLVV